MHKIGILWSEPERWQIGKNCHLENIICPTCESVQTAWVLHGHLNGQPDFHRMHLCDECGKYIGPFRWRLAADQPAADRGGCQAAAMASGAEPVGIEAGQMALDFG